MTNPAEIEIPLTIEVKAIGSGGAWKIIDLVDERDGTSLGDIEMHYFEADSEFMEALMNGALETLFEYESFDPMSFYSVSLSVREGGTEIGSATKYFPGHTLPLPPRNWRAAWIWPSVARYLPYLDDCQRLVEPADEYVRRMKATALTHWPEEVLREWLYRHYNSLEDYAFLEFETLRFELKVWDLNNIPGREAFRDVGFFDNFSNLKYRLENRHDWLAHYMYMHGTWNTPIVLLENTQKGLAFPNGNLLKRPYHLLEGHRRLSFLHGLKKEGRALPKHKVWVVRKIE